jgi:hypothetical protein
MFTTQYGSNLHIIRTFAILAVILILFGAGLAFAQATSSPESPAPFPSLTYPISELGNCESKDACRTYCSDPAHSSACIAFAETHGLMESHEAKVAREFIKLKGPGGCVGLACKTYCEDPAHADECLAFAKTHRLVSEKELKIAEEIQSRGGPGGCKSNAECRAFCADPSHREECMKFARTHIMADETEVSNEEIERRLGGKPGPGGCHGNACREYCSLEAHMEECMKFAKDNGLMSQEEIDRAEKFRNQTGPGGCRGIECRTYCQDAAHSEECLAFAEKNGFIKQDQASTTRRFLNAVGPGGCRGEECKEYCRDTAHLEECRQFAIQNGFMPRDERGQQFGDDPTRMGPPTGAPGMMQGPGGCKNREECEAFCKENPGQCRPLGPGNGQGTTSRPANVQAPFDASDMRSRCSSPEECRKLICSERPEVCENGVPRTNTSSGIPDRPMPPVPSPEQLRERCASSGGTWDGQRCSVPIPPPRNPGSGGGEYMPYMPSTMPDTTRMPMPPYPAPATPQPDSPSSMTPLSAFTASVFGIFQQLVK